MAACRPPSTASASPVKCSPRSIRVEGHSHTRSIPVIASHPAALRADRVARNDAKRKNRTMDIGFIGLGNMGFPMARRLIEAKHRLVVFDTRTEVVDKLVALGA